MQGKNHETMFLLEQAEDEDSMLNPSGLCLLSKAYYQQIRDGKRINFKGKPYAKNGHLPYQMTAQWILKYATENGDPDICEVHDGWLKKFIRFLYDQNISMNTVSGIVANLHAMVNALIVDGLPFSKLTLRIWPEEVFAVYNTERELKMIQKTKYSHETLKLARDLFLIHSHVGFRVGTLNRFLKSPKRFLFKQDDRWYIRITTNKTQATVVVPVKKIVHKILKKWDYKFPSVYHEHYYNPLIKAMGREAGLDQEMTYTKTINGKQVTFVKKKYEMMSSHTARRNFVTNAFLTGIPIEQLMLITGHRTREMFLRYVRADGLANAISVSNRKFFR